MKMGYINFSNLITSGSTSIFTLCTKFKINNKKKLKVKTVESNPRYFPEFPHAWALLHCFSTN